jgi:hypothetical protein
MEADIPFRYNAVASHTTIDYVAQRDADNEKLEGSLAGDCHRLVKLI